MSDPATGAKFSSGSGAIPGVSGMPCYRIPGDASGRSCGSPAFEQELPVCPKCSSSCSSARQQSAARSFFPGCIGCVCLDDAVAQGETLGTIRGGEPREEGPEVAGTVVLPTTREPERRRYVGHIGSSAAVGQAFRFITQLAVSARKWRVESPGVVPEIRERTRANTAPPKGEPCPRPNPEAGSERGRTKIPENSKLKS